MNGATACAKGGADNDNIEKFIVQGYPQKMRLQ